MPWGLGNNKTRQDICLLPETNSVKDSTLDADVLHAESPKTCEAWGMDARQQCIDECTGRYIQFLTPLSCDPVRIYRGSDHNVRMTDTGLVASQTEDQELTFLEEGKGHGVSMELWLVLIAGVLLLPILTLALLKGFKVI